MNVAHRERLIRNAQALLGAAPAPGLESMGPKLTRPALSAQDVEIVERVVNRRPVPDAGALHLEAIILPKLRPVFDIAHDSFAALPPE